jgi:cytidylate kinase
MAADASLVDTTGVPVEAVVERVLEIVRDRGKR